MDDKPLYIPLLLGTARQGRRSEHVANFVLSEMKKRPEIETELIDVRQLKMRLDDAGETMKDPEFAKKMTRADGLAIVTPEYNHGYPGLLKHALDMCLEEYVHKVVGLVGVSAGTLRGARGGGGMGGGGWGGGVGGSVFGGWFLRGWGGLSEGGEREEG